MPSRSNHKIISIYVVVSLLLIFGAALFFFKKSFIDSMNTVSSNFVQTCDDGNCHESNLPYQNPALSTEERAVDLLNRMTLAEKIGQMALVEKNSVNDLDDIAKYGLGALMSGGGGKPKDNTPVGWLKMTDEYKSYSQKTRLGIPLLYGTDANHGHSNIPEATIFPHAIGLGASKDQNLVKEVAKATAEEILATGINWVYSPDLDVTQNTRWGRTYETFGSSTESVSVLGRAYIEGLQSAELNGTSIAAAAKHYVGNGSSAWGSSTNKNFFIDQGKSNISESELRQTHITPFKEAIKSNVSSIMVGLNTWNNEKVTTNNHLLNDILRNELGFKGFTVSDWYGVFENENDKYSALVKAINAGIDMVMLPFDYKFFSDSMHQAIVNGDIQQTRIDEAVKRILIAKFEIGLFDHTATDISNLNIIGSEAHRKIARQAVRQSLVALKNNHVVPIAKNTSKILVSGSAADNLGRQFGGWTVEWQGIDGNWTPGTTILKGIRDSAPSSTKVEYELHGNFNKQNTLADMGIAVVGEKPYAEGWGDNINPQLSAEDLKTISNLKKVSKKIIVIIVSGRPLNINEYVNDWDAIIAAWLPGSEGQGVADVLFGGYPFTGTLPVSWNLLSQ